MQDIMQVEPSAGSLIADVFAPADYRDAFLVPAGDWEAVDDFASAYFLNQPQWLSLASMNLTSRKKLVDAIGDGRYERGSVVGSWKVYDRSEDEIVFGDNMGFMEYRFSMRLLPTGQVEASTAVNYRWQRMSHIYFTLVKPVHRKFVPLSLRAAMSAKPALAST